jgi:nucleotide-binding universal stress UspA family protein
MLNRRETGGDQHDLDRGNAQRRQEKAMILANILVHLDSRPRTAARLALSQRIAERTGARLTGLFAEKADAYVVGTVATWPSPHYTAAMESARAAFAAATASLKDRAAFIDINRGSDHEIIRRAIGIARTFDLIVLGQTEDDVPVPARLPDEVITESGRPVLVVPYVGTYADVGHRPLFAWHSSRGAARAASDALPLLANGCDALVIEVGDKNNPRDEFSDLLIANLAQHKAKARYQYSIVEEISVTDTLLSAISDHSADLMAIGAFDSGVHALFGHGAGTRNVLAHMTAPVLFSH